MSSASAAAGKARQPEHGRVPAWLQRLESPVTTYYVLLSVTAVLVIIGLIMVLSASAIVSYKSSDSSYTIFLRQAQFAAVGAVAMTVASRVSVATWKRFAVPALLGAMALQLLVFTPLGKSVNGNTNWIAVGPLSIQPSEFAKLGIVLFGAAVLTRKRKLLGHFKHALVPFVMPFSGLAILLVLLGHDLGTVIVMSAIVAAVLYTAGVSWRLFAVGGLGFGLLAAVMILTSENRLARFDVWLGKDTDPYGAARQPLHGRYALADGGWWGVGLGASREKWQWLSEPHNDFIYAIIGEELGLPGTLVVLALFAVLALVCYRLVLRTDDLFIRLATGGVMAWIVVQAIVNIGAVIGLLPVIGVPLPLVSSGGSSLVTTMLALGMLLSFARREPRLRRGAGGTAVRGAPLPGGAAGRAVARCGTRVRAGGRAMTSVPSPGAVPGSPSGSSLPRSVLLAGGGSAGHVSPLLALADALRRRDPDMVVTALGTEQGLESRLVPARGYELRTVPKVPLPRRPSADLARLPGNLRAAVAAAGRAIDETGAEVVVGFGGYVSTPAYLAARKRRVPIVVHEQNARPGIANRLGSARFTTHVATTFASTALRGATVVGMPLRREIALLDREGTRAEALEHFGLEADRPTVLVTGGSLGAQRLNHAFEARVDELCSAGVQILHITGLGKEFEPASEVVGPPYVVLAFADRMDLAYAAADLVVARAGANTVCELTAVGLPAIYVPLPIGNGEQRFNAADVVAAGGGYLVDDGATPEWIDRELIPLVGDGGRIQAMAEAAASVGERGADEALADMVQRAYAGSPRSGR